MRRPAIVIVTFKRQGLLAGLLESILGLTVAPWRVVVVDNENSHETARIVGEFSGRARALWGDTTDDLDAEGGADRVVYDPMGENTGGSGGFSEGVRRAHELGAEWFWVMDDDVAVEPDGLETLARWSEEARALLLAAPLLATPCDLQPPLARRLASRGALQAVQRALLRGRVLLA